MLDIRLVQLNPDGHTGNFSSSSVIMFWQDSEEIFVVDDVVSFVAKCWPHLDGVVCVH